MSDYEEAEELPASFAVADRVPKRYLYKVLVSQMPREFRYVQAATIEEAERQGIVVLLIGPADRP